MSNETRLCKDLLNRLLRNHLYRFLFLFLVVDGVGWGGRRYRYKVIACILTCCLHGMKFDLCTAHLSSVPTGNGDLLINKQGYSPIMDNSYAAMLAESPPRGFGKKEMLNLGSTVNPLYSEPLTIFHYFLIKKWNI